MKVAAAMRLVNTANASACLRDQRGLSTLEYALLFVVIIVGALTLWRKLGTSLAANVTEGQQTLSQTLDSAMAANRDSASPGPGSMAPRPAAHGGTTITPAANPTTTQVRPREPVSAARPTPGRSSSTATTPLEPQAKRGWLEQVKDYLVNSSGAQYALGIGAGILQGYTPGGFLVPSPYASSKPFELGRGLGQMGAGVAETVAGLGMVGGGGAATGVGAVASFTPASPAGIGLVAVGVPTTAAGVAVVANGVGATLSGYGTFINAMSMSDSTPPSAGGSASTSGGTPPATTPANASGAAGNAPRPTGVPADWVAKPSKTGGGTRFVDPKNPHNSVRVMPGDPKSPFPNSQQPYVRHLKDGQSLDVNGNVVPKNSPEAHIPLKDFSWPF